MSLREKTLKDTYGDLLQLDNSNNGVGTSIKKIKDGSGGGSALSIADDYVQVQPENDDTGNAFKVRNSSGTSIFNVDTDSEEITGAGNIMNTQYAYFGIGNSFSSNFAANTHYSLPFMGNNHVNTTHDNFAFGTSTDPATTFTTADATATHAALIVPCFWYVPDAISIDAVHSIEGADDGTGDTTRMHLFSYTYTSGSTSALTGGTLLAHNNDVTNAGSEQLYTGSWTVDSAAVTAGKVILGFFRSDSNNSDYSINMTIKYHLT